ncbi:MAG: hypothetical protein AABZ32_02165 [Bacteroidota bacterium]
MEYSKIINPSIGKHKKITDSAESSFQIFQTKDEKKLSQMLEKIQQWYINEVKKQSTDNVGT